MIKDLLIFFAATLILGGVFAGYLGWLITQSKPEISQAKAYLPPSQPNPEARQVIGSNPHS